MKKLFAGILMVSVLLAVSAVQAQEADATAVENNVVATTEEQFSAMNAMSDEA